MRNHRRGTFNLFILPCLAVLLASIQTNRALGQNQNADPLPSWNEGPAKEAILFFVTKVTDEDAPDYVPPEDRIATFDNDGTLWCEKPTVQAAFAEKRAIRLSALHPEWRDKTVFEGIAADDVQFENNVLDARSFRVLVATHNGMTQERFLRYVASFFRTAKHPRFKVSYKDVAFQPMLELLDYLRANQFETWICSGGGVHFMRVVTEDIYGIPPQQVIGSTSRLEYRVVDEDGKPELYRPLDENVTIDEIQVNNKETKPINIENNIGKRPIFAAGNVKSAGDIEMLRYCQLGEGRTLQLMVNHDDDQREYAYAEEDNASLNAAEEHGWTIVSIKKDWKQVFSFEE